MATNFVRNLFRKHPLITNSVIYGSLYVGAEYSSQKLGQKLARRGHEKPIDYASLGRFLVVGSLINSNYFYYWYGWLDRKYVGTSTKVIAKKVLLDQLVSTPPLYVIFYVTMSLLEGRRDIFAECREKFYKTFALSCVFWFPVQTFNFLYLPNALRIVFMGMCSFVWVNILCWIKRNRPATDSKDV